MKIYDILREDLDIRQIDGGYEIFDTETGRRAPGTIVYPDDGAAEEARDRIRQRTRASLRADPTQRSAADRGDAERGRIYPGVRPGTPTSDSLSAGERRRLARTGSITRNGITVTRAQISAADAEAEALRRSGRGSDVRPGDDRPSAAASQNRNPDGEINKSWLRRFLGATWNHPAVRGLRTFFGGTGMAALQTAFNAAQAEDALDGYFRAIRTESQRVGREGQAEFIANMTSGNFPQSVATAYVNTVERFNQLWLEAVLGVVLAGGWTAYVLLTGFSLGTGFVGAILALVAGGVVVVGGTTAISEIFERVGIMDWFEDKVTSRLLSPRTILGLAITVDGYQEVFGEVADQWGRILTIGNIDNAGDLIRDSIVHEENNGTVSPSEAKDIVTDIIKSSPELLAAYNQGKEEAKEIMRSGEPESN